MSDIEKMQLEFEEAAKTSGLSLLKDNSGEYFWSSTKHRWLGFQLGYKAWRSAGHAELERLRVELAAAKAASAVPVEISTIENSEHPNICRVWVTQRKDRTKFVNWLRDRMKERGNQ